MQTIPWLTMHLQLLGLQYQASQHYSPTDHHIHQYTKLPLEQGFPNENINLHLNN